MKHTHMRGMSLIELLTVVMIVGILSALAVSTYTNYTLRANRTEGTTALLRIQVAEEKFYLANNTYTTDLSPAGLGVFPNTTTTTTSTGRYTLSVAAGGTTSIGSSYVATAAAAGVQLKDTSCPTYTINESGARTPADSTGCWK